MNCKCLIVMLVFVSILGLYMCYPLKKNESFSGGSDNTSIPARCPNILIKKGNQFYLYNSKLVGVPGVNPIVFSNLEDYTEFISWQRGKGIFCPVLQLREEFDAQGNPILKQHDNLNDVDGGLPSKNAFTEEKRLDANLQNIPFNKTGIAAYDSKNQSVGSKTSIDNIYLNKTEVISALDITRPKNTQPLA